MAKRASAAERKAFIKEQESKELHTAADRGGPKGVASYLRGGIRVPPGDTSFIDKSGRIVKPIAGEYELKSAGRKSHYDSTRAGLDESNSRYHSYNRLNAGAYATLGVVGILGGIFLLSANLTGNAVANLTATNSTWIGGAFFLIGLIGCFSWIRSNKKK